ncbi:MAG TPA: hypothetical protein P5555_04240 [Candidatus Paceibacterota bacterium]|nr:hypothetical protein [Verrucomicrobiota bacterium]HRZ44381.1 hypothetical protein [Candidatus Paceibacterota bacterium]
MKTIRPLLVAALFAAIVPLSAQVSIAPGTTHREDFSALGTSSGAWWDNFTLAGWYASVSNVTDGVVGPYTTAYTATAGASGNSSTLYSLGASGSSERALGGTPVTTRYGMLGLRLVNGGNSTITNLILSYDGEQWRRDATVNTHIHVSYKIFPQGAVGGLDSLDGWTAAPESLTFNAPTTGNAGALDGNNPANRAAGLTAAFPGISVQPGDEIWFKWTLIKVSGGNIHVGIDNVTVSVPMGTPPVIGEIPDITVVATQTSVTNSFTVNDAEDDAASAPLPVPTATSSNEAVVPSANVFFDGSGSNRTVYVIAGDRAGSADITVSIIDSHGNTGQQTFAVTVLPLDFAPSISTPPPTNTLVNTPVAVPFTVADPETPASALTVSASVASYSGGILESVTLEADSGGTNRAAIVKPVADATGVGVVILSVTDATGQTTTASFAVMVRPSAGVVLIDHFDYPFNTSILNSSPGFWVRRNSSAQGINFRTASSDAQAWIRPKSGADDASVPLSGGPYVPGSGTVLFTMFKAQWIDVGDVPVVGDSSGAFILLAPGSGASADQLMQVATRTTGAPEGAFRLHISNGESIYTEYSMTDLYMGTVYSIVVRHDVDTAKSTLWIDATSEASPSVSATDLQTPAPISHLSIRQEPDMGNIYVDDLKVIAIRKPRLMSITPPLGGGLEIVFAGGARDTTGDFEVERAASVNGPFGGVNATITDLGEGTFQAAAPASGDQSYYRVKRKPIDF